MSKWEMVRLSDVVAETITGEWGTECVDGEKGVKVLRTTNFTNLGVVSYNRVVVRSIPASKVDKKKLERFDIILEKSGGSDNQPVGRVVFFDNRTDEIYLCNNFTQILRVDQNIAFPKYVFRYLYHLHQNGTTELLQNKTTGIRNLQLKSYMALGIPLPPLPVQQQIADVLDRANALIEKRKAQIEKLDLLVKSQFIEMFGDPVTNPKGWEIVELKKVCDVRDGTHDSPKYVSEGFPLLTSKNFTKGFVDFEDANLISKLDFQAINQRSKVDYGDIVMPMIGTIGSPVIINTKRPFAIKNVALIKFNDDCITNIYLKTLLSTNFLEYSIQQNNRGGTQKFIALGDIRRLQIPLPPLSSQKRYTAFVHQVETPKSLLQQSLAKLEQNYKSLMQKCFRGEVF